MWTLRIASFVTLAAAIAAWIAQDVIISRYIGMQVSAFGLFLIAHPVSKIGMMLLLALGSLLCVASLIVVLARQSPPKAGSSSPLDLVIWFGIAALIGLSLLVNGYLELNIQAGINELGHIRFAISAPQRVEQFLIFSLALWPSAFALLVLLLARTRHAKAVAV